MSRASTPLPATPADALHILPPESLWLLLAAVAMLLLLLLWLVLRRLFRRRPRPDAAPPPPPPRQPSVVTPASDVATRIKAIEGEFLESKAYREGCHVLAAAARSHLGRDTGLAVERMTSPEIARAIEDRRIGAFMIALSRRGYGADEPRRGHFAEACAKAQELLA